jgi:Cu2+-exporting ATPase
MQQETGHQQHGVQPPGGMQHGEHIDHTGHEELFRRRFWVSLMLSIPVLLYSPMVQDWLNFSMPEFSGSRWVTLAFSVVIFLYGGIPFLQMAGPELRQRKPGMMTLISMAISVAFVYSLAAFSGDFGEGFFWELVTLIDVMLLGHWLEMRSVRQASGALNELAKLMPDTAERLLPDGQTETVPASDLRVGDLILVRPGASVPADGEVVEGESEVNEAMITGESRPVPKVEGDRLIAGTVNGDGSLRVQVTAVGEETALAGIMRLVEEAQQSKSSTQVLADKAAGWLFYTAVAVAAITAVAWAVAVGLGGELIERVVTILVIACPHALGLAIPLVVAISTTLAARNGVLVRSRLALEEVRRADVVVFDKTGTLTRGEFGVSGLKASSEMGEDEALALTAAIEGDSEHIIARAIRGEAEARGLSLPKVLDFEVFKGRGVRAMVNGQSFYVGGPRLLEMLKLNLSPELADFTGAAGRKGQTVVYLASPDQVQAAFALADVIRTESREAVRRLKEMGVEVAMLTGDSRAVAEAVAVELGIQTYFAEVLPEHKDQKVVELQAQGKRVAMVGDGINDAPALIRADVGIAIGSGTDVAVESAGIILVRNNPLDVVKVMELSRASYRKMVQNLLWATGYNVVALPLAAGVLAPVGILLTPAVGALFMSLSTVIVAINAQFLRRIRLEKRPSTSAL